MASQKISVQTFLKLLSDMKIDVCFRLPPDMTMALAPPPPLQMAAAPVVPFVVLKH